MVGSSHVRWIAALAIALAAGACERKRASAPAAETPAATEPDDACDGIPAHPLRHDAVDRLVAIGDLHGDLDAARSALRLAGAIDERDRWIGGELAVVQTGDVLDRGDDEREIEQLLDRLEGEAAAAGGSVHRLLGNHEVMNVAGDFRYVTEGGLADYPDRAAAFEPGGPEAMRLARRNVVEIVGDTVFVHGGVLPRHVDYGLAKLNREVACWMAGAAAELPAVVNDPEAPIWTRAYAMNADRCEVLARTLDALDARRMVVGHTPQVAGITGDCDGALWRIDVGMAAAYGGPVQVLELARGEPPRPLLQSPP